MRFDSLAWSRSETKPSASLLWVQRDERAAPVIPRLLLLQATLRLELSSYPEVFGSFFPSTYQTFSTDWNLGSIITTYILH